MHHPVVWAIRRSAVFAMAVLAGACDLVNPPAAAPAPATVAAPVPTGPQIADRVVVSKTLRTLDLERNGKVFASFPIALGPDAKGPKREAGDKKTPEGAYRIDWKSLKTKYSRELHISYPGAQDRARAAAAGVEPGGGIFIHGLPSDFGPYDPPVWVKDWTDGCIAVGNAAIVKIWDAVPDGTPIEILP